MAFAYNAQAFPLLALLFSSMFAIGLANYDFNWGSRTWNKTNFPYTHPSNVTHTSNRFIVGGSENWHYGFNYMDWARNNTPFFVNDTLGIYLSLLYTLSFLLHNKFKGGVEGLQLNLLR